MEIQVFRWPSHVVWQNFVLRSHDERHISHCRLHSSLPMLDEQLEHVLHDQLHSVSARLQLLLHCDSSP